MTGAQDTSNKQTLWRTIVEWSKDIWPVTRLALLTFTMLGAAGAWAIKTPGLLSTLVNLAVAVFSIGFWV